MRTEHYILSAMCQYDDACVYGITKLKPYHFTGTNKKVYTLIKVLYQKQKKIDYHVFITQLKAYGISESDSGLIYTYCTDYSSQWKPVFDELKKLRVYDKIRDDVQIIDELRSNMEPVEKISSKTSSMAADWITETEKRYYSGKEIDEEKIEYGKPIRTGHPLYDDVIYAKGGNRRGEMKGVVCRYKHGKTRSECWEVAQNMRMGHKVLYITVEGRKHKIRDYVKQVLRHEWDQYRENLFVVDGVLGLDELESIIIEAVMIDGVEKVVADYVQELLPDVKFTGENEKINQSLSRLGNLMVRYDFHCAALSQVKKEAQWSTIPKDANGHQLMPSGYKYVPSTNDVYGSDALNKWSTLVMIGFRPNQYEELIKASALGKRIVSPKDSEESYHSFFMKTAINREDSENLHKWWHFVDSSDGLQFRGWL